MLISHGAKNGFVTGRKRADNCLEAKKSQLSREI
jgi:hypothetical protein